MPTNEREELSSERLVRPDGWDNTDEDKIRTVLRALEERQALLNNLTSTQERCNTLIEETRKERRRRKKLEHALHQILQWDCLNPPRPDLLSDLPWLRKLVEVALKND